MPQKTLTKIHGGDIFSLTRHNFIAGAIAVEDGGEGFAVHVALHRGQTWRWWHRQQDRDVP